MRRIGVAGPWEECCARRASLFTIGCLNYLGALFTPTIHTQTAIRFPIRNPKSAIGNRQSAIRNLTSQACAHLHRPHALGAANLTKERRTDVGIGASVIHLEI